MPDYPPIHRIEISTTDMQRMLQSVAALAPEEACGLLPGSRAVGVYRVTEVIPVPNELHSPVRYRMEPLAQLKAFNRIDGLGLELAGIYHSHPDGPPYPSPTDIAEAYYPESVYLIWSATSGAWSCQAFTIQDGQVSRVELAEPDFE